MLHRGTVLGLDEKALTKAIYHSFPGAKRLLCTTHLKDNLQHREEAIPG